MALSRRNFLASSSLLAAATTTAVASTSPAIAAPLAAAPQLAAKDNSIELNFDRSGAFKVIQFNDTQDNHLTDTRTIEFMGKVLDEEKPGFALINGDVINGDPSTAEEVYQAINNVVLPMEERGIPWALTFGNHDEDSAEDNNTGVRHAQMVEFIRSYRHNCNAPAETGGYGASNTLLTLHDAHRPRFAFWLLDSGRYRPDELGGQNAGELPSYDYIHPQQIQWYTQASDALAEQAGHTIEGLMFFHIPTFEHRDMWFGGPYNDGLIDHKRAVETHGIVGDKNEDVYVGAFNSGIYAAAQARGDIRGMYCGHDHINTYMGNYFGIELGYGPGTGFGTYGLADGTPKQHTLRGARVFEFNANDAAVYTGTRTVFAKDLGVDMSIIRQELDAPAKFPDYVRIPGAASHPDASSDNPGSSPSSSGSSTGSSR